METKRNLKYYIASPINIGLIIGAVITLVMLILSFSKDTRIIGILGIIVGLGVMIFASGGKSNDSDIDYQSKERIKDLQENSMKKFDVYEKNFLKMMKPIDLEGYDFEPKEEEFYYKKGQDGTPRTNYFAGYNLIFTGEKVYIYGRRLSLTNEEIDETIASSYKYTELDKAELLEKTYTPEKGEPVKYYVFKIVAKDGSDAPSTCIDYGADSDKAVDDINHAIEVRCVELEKMAAEKAEKLAAFRAKVLAEAAEAEKENSAE